MPSAFYSDPNLISSPNTVLGHPLHLAYRQSNGSVSDHEAESSSSVTPPLLPSDNHKNPSRRAKVSTLPYHNSARDSVDFSRQRDSRWLVLVLPPTHLIKEITGHALASGPSNRLSQGVLLPLLPTMYAQLIAIAHEFNFPSTHGLSLYMHVVDGGTLFVPRISAESWSIFWSNLSEGNVPVSQSSLPISCRIEFDIDPTRALWYNAWASAPKKETSIPSIPTSHRRQETVVTMTSDDKLDIMPVFPQESTGSTPPRHVPKKLSLVDRVTTNIIPGRSGSQADTDRHPSSQIVHPNIGAPGNLQTQSWRDSAVSRNMLTDTHLHLENTSQLVNSLTGSVRSQPKPTSDGYALSTPSSRLSSEFSSPALPTHVPSVLRDGHFTESVAVYDSSSSQASVTHVPIRDMATGMDREMPSTKSNDGNWKPSSRPDISRMPLPDLAGWNFPATPSTATLWKPSNFLTPSSRDDTMDVAQIAFGLREDTATQSVPWRFCWPAFQSHPTKLPSPKVLLENSRYPFFVIYPPKYPYFDIYPTITPRHDGYLSCDLRQGIDTRSSQRVLSENFSYPLVIVYPPTYPHFNLYPAISPRSDGHASAEAKQEMPAQSPSQKVLFRNSDYPLFVVYPPTYPHFDIYPALPHRKGGYKPPDSKKELVARFPSNQALSENSGYPRFVIYLPTYPHFDIYPGIALRNNGCCSCDSRQDVKPSLQRVPPENHGYPFFVIYPATYPHFDIYPAPPPRNDGFTSPNSRQELVVRSSTQQALFENSGYPLFVIYPPTYPHFDIYPTIAPRNDGSSSPDSRQKADASPYSQRALDENSGYPFFVIYPPTYPYFDIYPAIASKNDGCSSPELRQEMDERHSFPQVLSEKSGYPFFVIYPPAHPHFNIYPALTPPNDGYASPGSRQRIAVRSSSQQVPFQISGYPFFVIYPSTYPHFDIYPAFAQRDDGRASFGSMREIATRPSQRVLSENFGYPLFVIYPPAYPHFNFYPSTTSPNLTVKSAPWKFCWPAFQPHVENLRPQQALLGNSGYPLFVIYPPTYPHFDIYPAIAGRNDGGASSSHSRPEIATQSAPWKFCWPAFRPYLASPPSPPRQMLSGHSGYPFFVIYPPAYPHFNIYPAVAA